MGRQLRPSVWLPFLLQTASSFFSDKQDCKHSTALDWGRLIYRLFPTPSARLIHVSDCYQSTVLWLAHFLKSIVWGTKTNSVIHIFVMWHSSLQQTIQASLGTKLVVGATTQTLLCGELVGSVNALCEVSHQRPEVDLWSAMTPLFPTTQLWPCMTVLW